MIQKSLIIIVLLLFSFNTIQSQEFYAGPIVGSAFTQVDGDSYAGFNKVGLRLGGFVGRRIWNDWQVQLEIMYVQKGSKHTPDVEAGDYEDYELKLNYIEIPLMLRYNFDKFSIEGGLSYGSLLSNEEFEDGISFENIPQYEPVQFKDYEIATQFGASYHINKRLKANIRFSYSLFRIRVPFNNEIPLYNPHWSLKQIGQYNDVISLSIYYDLFYNYN